MKKFKNKNAITLIALVITIVVLLILAGVALSLVVGENGITERAVKASKTQNIAGAKEKLELDIANYASEFYQAKYVDSDETATSLKGYILGKIATGENYTVDEKDATTGEIRISIADGTNATCTINDDGQVVWAGAEPAQTGTLISKEAGADYTGYYADVDGDGSVDGVIYVDLLAKSGTSGSWGGVSYTIPTVTASELKDYTISEETHTENNSFGTKNIIRLANGTSGNDRFYVMALQDLTANGYSTFYWYKNACYSDEEAGEDVGKMTDYATTTSENFGAGKTNTNNMKDKCELLEVDEGYYGIVDSRDIWGNVTDGWFVPSNGEWGAFGDSFPMEIIYIEGYGDVFNIETYGLREFYWSSSQYGMCGAYNVEGYFRGNC